MIDGPRPQPVGALPWPAGMLLLPATQACTELAAALVLGIVPDVWPGEAEFMRIALEGNAELAALAISGDDLVAQYNRAVLVGGAGVWASLADSADGELGALVDVARFSVGEIDAPPSVDGTTAEVTAVVRSARASGALERGDLPSALEELRHGAEDAAAAGSPILAASLRLNLAELLREQADDPASALREAEAALRVLPLTANRDLRAELQVTRALSRQQLAGNDRGLLMGVVADLTEAVKIFREDTHPEMFAVCNQHLALAYLVMPMNDEADRIRIGVAVNSLRAALRVYTPQSHPVAWASTQLNLANALQYLPSVHQESNLDEAVQLYEEVLQVRTEESDPLGYARILANQGNALGHLGVFTDARERLDRAREIFADCGDLDAATSVDEVRHSLAEAEAAAGRDA